MKQAMKCGVLNEDPGVLGRPRGFYAKSASGEVRSQGLKPGG